MKREIKFRAWDHQDEIMIYSDDEFDNYFFEPHNDDGILRAYRIYDTYDSSGAPGRSIEEIEVMQYTGLKDKNGKEIYEGDIVKWDVNDITRTAPVYYDERQASFWMGRDKDSGHLVLNDWMRGEFEIIGNIYENPELINNSNNEVRDIE